MKRIFAGFFLALFSLASFGVTTSPVSLLNPAGSTAGYVVRSTGPTTAPAWAAIGTADLPVVPITKGGTGATTASAGLAALGGVTAAQANGRLLATQVFSSSGTYTPTAGATKIRIRLQAAGGGGGGAPAAGASAASIGQTGSAGAYCEAMFSGTQTTQTVTVGAGGTAGTTSTAGGNGGPTSVGSLVSATGGGGGAFGTAAAAPFVSVGTTAQLSSCTFGGGATAIVSGTGPIGSPGAVISNTVGFSGLGASTAFGYGGQARGLGPSSSTGGSNGTGYGSSGSGGSVGASGAAAAGGAGAPALVIIDEYN